MSGPHRSGPLAACYFLAASILLIPYPGIEADEALFAGGIYTPERMAAAVSLVGKPLCLMIMPYIGALKAWLYAPLFALVEPSVWSLRLPVALAGATTVLLFAAMLASLAGPRAAWIGALLLATDPVFLTTTIFDWGPVAFGQLLLVGGLLALVRFRKLQREGYLIGGCAALGLAVFHKATFVWILLALAAPAVVLGGAELRRLAARHGFRAVGAFLLGMLPFLLYLARQPGEPWRGRSLGLRDLGQKIEVMKRSIRGDAMAGFLVSAEAPGAEGRPDKAVERASLWLSDVAGRRITGLGLWLAALAAPGLILGPHRRAALFFVVAFLLAWAQMLVTVEAGGSVHHTVMLWPLLYGSIALGLASLAAARPSGSLVVVSAVLSGAFLNLVATNEHLARLVRFGPGPMWTDAIFELAGRVRDAGARRFHPADWGMGDQVRLLSAGRIAVEEAIQPFSRETLDEDETRRILERLERPEALFARHVPGREYFPRAGRLLEEVARENGFQAEVVEVIRDRRGRPVYELLRFRRATMHF